MISRVKLLYLGLRNISQQLETFKMKQAMSQFMIRFDKQFDRARNFNKHKI
jgi:hypothetical protein